MSRQEEIIRLRELLTQKRNALRKSLHADLRLLRDPRSQNHGNVSDAANALADDEVSTRLAEEACRELERIDHALSSTNFGVCEGCGKRIPMARLMALPYATRCVNCQREHEENKEVSTATVDAI